MSHHQSGRLPTHIVIHSHMQYEACARARAHTHTCMVTNAHLPHFTKFCLNVQVSTFLPCFDKSYTVGMRW